MPGHNGAMRRTCTGLLLAALALAGCGQDANGDAVRTVTARFYTAVAQHDGALACRQLAQPTVKQLEQNEKATCSKAIGALGLAPARIAHVAVYVTNAKVDLTNGASAFLEETATGWRISALGCRPTGGDPKVQPLGCAVQS
jgi:hypothetical protein